MNLDRIFSTPEIAAITGIHRQSVWRAVKEGRLHANRIGKRLYYIKADDLAEFQPRLPMGRPRKPRPEQLQG